MELPPLHRLIKRAAAQALLEAFTADGPGRGLALLQPDGTSLASAGTWPGDHPPQEFSRALAYPVGDSARVAGGCTLYPLRSGGELLGGLAAYGIVPGLEGLRRSLDLLLTQGWGLRVMARETLERYREINLLYHVGETIGACLNPEEIPCLVLNDAREVLRAEVGAVLLVGQDDPADLDLQESLGAADQVLALLDTSRALIDQVRRTGRPDLLSDIVASDIVASDTLASDPTAGQPLGATPISTALCAPLQAGERSLGVVLLGRIAGHPPFTAGDEKLAMALAGQAAIAIERAWLHQQELERQRLEEELAIGRRIQLSLLPGACPIHPGWEFAAYYQAARQVGGDFYDFIELPAGRIGLVIADVTGKGVPAALMMAFTRALLRAESRDTLSPKAVLERASQIIVADNRARLFLSAFYAVLEPGSGRLVYANGGHERPFWLRAAGGECRELASRSTLLGAFSTLALEERQVQIEPGDLVVFYTDGVTEARDESGELFNEERLQAVVLSCAGASAAEALKTIIQAVTAFVGSAPQADDFTLVVARRKGSA